MQARAILLFAVVSACTEPAESTAEALSSVATIKDVIGDNCAAFEPDPEDIDVPSHGHDLQLTTIPTTVFANAMCNDNSAAVLYFRPGHDEGLKSWLIELEGGGACRTPSECARRYCWQDGAGREKMTSDYAVANGDIRATGIQSLTEGPFKDYNHVFIHYCSSDIWSGIAPAQDGTSYMPPFFVVEKTFTIRFEGHSILQAAIGLLRKDGVTPLTFTLEGNNVAMPDLDDATGTVVIAGGSAGGSGVERQLDRVVQQLIANHNPDKTLPFYAGFIDSAFAPKLEGLGFQLTSPCTDDNRCDWRGYVEDTQGYYPHTTDTSCAAMHPTELYKCTDTSHLVRNHLTTPFFIRQGQTDSLLSSKYENEWKLATSPASTATAPMTVDEFASQVRAQARTIPTWNSIAEEPPGKLPGSFVPLCSTHDPLRDRAALFDTTIDGWTWGQVWANWLTTSATPRRIIGDPAIGVVSVCK